MKVNAINEVNDCIILRECLFGDTPIETEGEPLRYVGGTPEGIRVLDGWVEGVLDGVLDGWMENG